MAKAENQNTSSMERSLDTTNFDFSELSTNKETIWNGYFLRVLSDIPREAVARAVGTAEIPEDATSSPDRRNESSRSTFVDRLSSLEGKVASRPAFKKRFYGQETFRGLVAEAEAGKRFLAVMQDRSGERYEYIFAEDELPEKQRSEVRVGSPVVVHIGYEYRGSTRTNLMKIYLANYEKVRSKVRENLISSKAASWDF